MKTITFGSYNIQRGVGLDWKRDIDRTADVIAEMSCDVIGLQEVVMRGDSTRGDQAHYLGDRLGMTVVSGPTRRHQGGLFGNVVLTRLPVREVSRLDLSVGNSEPRGCLRVDVEGPTGVVHVHNCHFGLSPWERRSQLTRLIAILRESDGPKVVMGDFNEWYDGPVTQSLWRELSPTAPAVPRTHPACLPLFALDRLYGDDVLHAGAMQVHSTPKSRVASDHLPIVVQFEPARAVG